MSTGLKNTITRISDSIKYLWVSVYTRHLVLFMRKNTYNGQVTDYS